MVSTLIAWRRVRPQTQGWPLRKALIHRLVSDACLLLGTPWLILSFSLALTICKS